jgi:antitoxin VapB
MHATAKLFTTGNSQAMRLPKAFRFKTSEVWITRNDATGEVTLRPKPGPDELQGFLDLLEAAPVDGPVFLPERDETMAGDPFEEDVGPSPVFLHDGGGPGRSPTAPGGGPQAVEPATATRSRP